jgi:hypothetical protein
VNTNMIRLFGRAPTGERVIGHVPFSAWKTVTFVAARRHDGMTAPMMIKGAMNGDAFLAAPNRNTSALAHCPHRSTSAAR